MSYQVFIYQVFDPNILPGDDRYIPPGVNAEGGEEGDCLSACRGYSCTLDRGHTGPHVAHGLDMIDGQQVSPMYAQWEEVDGKERAKFEAEEFAL